MWRISMRVVALCFLIAAFPLVTNVLAASETARDQDRILTFNSDLTILADGTLKVREIIRMHNGGGSFENGLQRRFTSTRHDQHGRTWNVSYENIIVLRDGNPESFSQETVDDNLLVQTHPAGGGLPVG